MPRIGIGIGIQFTRVLGVGIDAQAQAHYDRVIADGGAIPSGLLGCNSFFVAVKAVYSTTDITTALSAGYDPHYLGFKMGAGSGTTLGQAAQKLYSCCGSSGDLLQTTAASQPLLLEHSGDNYWFGSGLAGNYCSTPNAVANQITGDIEFIAKVNFQDSGSQDTIFIKSDAVAGSSYCYSFWKNGNNLAISYSNDGTVAARVTTISNVSLSSIGYTYGTDIWVKGSRNATTGDVKFYYGSDGVSWTQLGTTQTTTAQSIFNASIPLWIGDWANILFPFKGKIYRATISNSIGGTPVVDFNPNTYNASTSQTEWTSQTGEVWTINTGTAATGYKGVLVDRTIAQGDGIDDRMTSGTLTSKQYFTRYIAINNLYFSGRFVDGNSALTHTIYGTASNFSMFGGSGGFDFVGEVQNRRQLLTANWQAAPNVYNRINNSARATTASSIGSASDTGNNLFTDGGGANPANVTLYTMVDSLTNDPLTDAMYNAISTFNNNAF